MNIKRKHRAESSSVSSSKRDKATPNSPTSQASHFNKSDPVTPPTARHLQPITESGLNSTANLSSPGTFAAATRVTKAVPGSHLGQSHLIPRSERRPAKVGHKDETLLRILCDDHNTGEVKELHFRNIPHSSIDWDNGEHIHKINNWRNQIYGRAGFKSKAVTMWLLDEELWFELYFRLSIAESTMHGILLPKNSQVMDSFNNTFVGRIIRDQNGQVSAPRAERKPNAFASKFNRMFPELRTQLKQCILGMSGDVFVPDITLDMLYAYKKAKTELKESGTKDECVYAGQLQEWCYQLGQQPDISHATTPKRELSMAEDDAVAVLVSLSQESDKSEGEDDMLETANNSADRKATEGSLSSSMQHPTAPPSRPENTWLSPEPEPFSSSTTSLQQCDTSVTPPHDQSVLNNTDYSTKYQRCATPICELDITSLIASPD